MGSSGKKEVINMELSGIFRQAISSYRDDPKIRKIILGYIERLIKIEEKKVKDLENLMATIISKLD